ncbi:MAG: VTT domain-containing protein [Candidatus Nanoarchaeia archaeon]
MKLSKTLSIIIVIVLLSLFLLLGFSGIDLIGAMINVNDYFYNLLGPWGIYISIFLISIFGNFTIILPVPYMLTIMTALLVMPVNPLILAVFAALGASIGELSAWLLGRGAAELIDKKRYMGKIKGLESLIEKGYGFPLIILYAATPLPDDILLIALGMKKYSLKNSLIASFIGKLLMVLALIFAVFIAKNTFIGQVVLYLFGLDISNGTVTSAGNTFVSTITLTVTFVITMLLIMVDWERVWKRIKKKNTSKK